MARGWEKAFHLAHIALWHSGLLATGERWRPRKLDPMKPCLHQCQCLECLEQHAPMPWICSKSLRWERSSRMTGAGSGVTLSRGLSINRRFFQTPHPISFRHPISAKDTLKIVQSPYFSPFLSVLGGLPCLSWLGRPTQKKLLWNRTTGPLFRVSLGFVKNWRQIGCGA